MNPNTNPPLRYSPPRSPLPVDAPTPSSPEARPLSVNDALSYLEMVKVKLQDKPDIYSHFLDIMKDRKSQAVDTPGVIERVSSLFNGHTALIQGFNTFLPHGYRIDCTVEHEHSLITVTTPSGTTTQTTGGPSRHVLSTHASPAPYPALAHSTLPAGPLPPLPASPYSPATIHAVAALQSGGQSLIPSATQAAAASLTGSAIHPDSVLAQKRAPAMVEFNQAVNYVNKIKQRFASDPDTYKQFLEILQTYQKEQHPIAEMYQQVNVLFNNQRDLLEDFQHFLPDHSGTLFGTMAQIQAAEGNWGREDKSTKGKEPSTSGAPLTKPGPSTTDKDKRKDAKEREREKERQRERERERLEREAREREKEKVKRKKWGSETKPEKNGKPGNNSKRVKVAHPSASHPRDLTPTPPQRLGSAQSQDSISLLEQPATHTDDVSSIISSHGLDSLIYPTGEADSNWPTTTAVTSLTSSEYVLRPHHVRREDYKNRIGKPAWATSDWLSANPRDIMSGPPYGGSGGSISKQSADTGATLSGMTPQIQVTKGNRGRPGGELSKGEEIGGGGDILPITANLGPPRVTHNGTSARPPILQKRQSSKLPHGSHPAARSQSSSHIQNLGPDSDFPIEVGYDNYQLREDEYSRGVTQQVHSKSKIHVIELPGMNEHTQSLSGSSMQIVRSNKMTSLEMFECLIAHGCSDLRAYIHPDHISSCRAAEGAFGDVWKGKLIDGTDVAIKVLRYALVRDDGLKNMKYLKQHNGVNRYALCCQIAEGVAYLHSVNMIHGDLKACNILISADGILKLTDFDYSIISGLSLAFSATTRTGGGTLRWMAPELVLAMDEDPAERSKQTDVYALGMTILASVTSVPTDVSNFTIQETITNNAPYSECRQDHQIYGKHTRKEHPRRSMEYFPDGWRGDRMWNFLVKCWSYDATSRPTADDVLAFLLTGSNMAPPYSKPQSPPSLIIPINHPLPPPIDPNASLFEATQPGLFPPPSLGFIPATPVTPPANQPKLSFQELLRQQVAQRRAACESFYAYFLSFLASVLTSLARAHSSNPSHSSHKPAEAGLPRYPSPAGGTKERGLAKTKSTLNARFLANQGKFGKTT